MRKLPIENFFEQLPTNVEMPFQQDVPAHKEFSAPEEDLPESVERVIAEIKGADTMIEKAHIAHSFTMSYIQGIPDDGFETNGKPTFEKLSKSPIGDCDDYASFNQGLLLRGGADPSQVFYIVTLSEFNYSNGDSIQGGHAVIVAQDEFGSYVLLDNMLSEAVDFYPEDGKATTRAVSIENSNDLESLFATVTSELTAPAIIKDGHGNSYISEKGLKELQEQRYGQESAMDLGNNRINAIGTSPPV